MFCGALRTAVAVFAHQMCIIWCKSLSQSLKCSSLTPHEAPELAKLQGRVVCGSKVNIAAGISARDDSAAMEIFFF